MRAGENGYVVPRIEDRSYVGAFTPVYEYGRGRIFSEVAIVVPPPAVNTRRIVEICTSVPSRGGRKDNMESLYRRCCGIDVHKKMLTVCVLAPVGSQCVAMKEQKFR